MQPVKETKSKPPYKRSMRNILINPGYQMRYIFWITTTSLSLITLYSALTYHYIRENYAILVDLSPMTDDR